MSNTSSILIDCASPSLKVIADEQLMEVNLPDWQREVWNLVNDWFDDSIESFFINTSGTTGTPKTILHTKAQMIASAKLTCNYLELKTEQTALLCLPVNKIGGRMMLVRALIQGLKLLVVKPQANPLLETEFDKIHFAAFTPMQVHAILSNPTTAEKFNRIEKAIIGGGEISNALRAMLPTIPPAIYETYGMTETISHIALRKINGTAPEQSFKAFTGINLSQDERGCLVINAPMLSDETIVTNDLVKLDSTNTFEWLGRWDNVINTGGIKVFPEEIERKIAPLLPFPFYIGKLPDAALGEKVTLFITEENKLPSAAILLPFFNQYLTKAEQPKQVAVFHSFNYTETGKLIRSVLSNQAIRIEPIIASE